MSLHIYETEASLFIYNDSTSTTFRTSCARVTNLDAKQKARICVPIEYKLLASSIEVLHALSFGLGHTLYTRKRRLPVPVIST